MMLLGAMRPLAATWVNRHDLPRFRIHLHSMRTRWLHTMILHPATRKRRQAWGEDSPTMLQDLTSPGICVRNTSSLIVMIAMILPHLEIGEEWQYVLGTWVQVAKAVAMNLTKAMAKEGEEEAVPIPILRCSTGCQGGQSIHLQPPSLDTRNQMQENRMVFMSQRLMTKARLEQLR